MASGKTGGTTSPLASQDKRELGRCNYCLFLFVIDMRHGKLERIDPETGEVHHCEQDPAIARRRSIVEAILRAGKRGKL